MWHPIKKNCLLCASLLRGVPPKLFTMWKQMSLWVQIKYTWLLWGVLLNTHDWLDSNKIHMAPHEECFWKQMSLWIQTKFTWLLMRSVSENKWVFGFKQNSHGSSEIGVNQTKTTLGTKSLFQKNHTWSGNSHNIAFCRLKAMAGPIANQLVPLRQLQCFHADTSRTKLTSSILQSPT